MMSKADNLAAHASRSHNPHDPKTALSSASLADAAQVFLDILDLHQGPGVYLVLAPSGAARQRLMARWRDLARDRGYRVITVNYTPQSRAPDLLALAGKLQERSAVFVDLDEALSWAVAEPTGLADLDERMQQARRSLQSLNLARERLRRLPAPLFFWMSPEVLRAFARYAADLFAVRSGLLEVLELPPPTAAAALARVESKTLWPSRYAHLPREEREGRLRLLLEALEREARRSQPNLYRLARYHLDAAEILGSLEQYERALHHAQQALNLARKVNDPALQAASWLAIGQGLAALGRYDEALRAIQQAGTLFEQVGDSLKRAHTLHQMANIYRVRGDLARALDLYRQSLAIQERLGERLGQANTLKAMGDVLQFQKDLEGAMAHYRQALALFEQVGDRLGQAYTLKAMGDVLQFQKDLEGAMAHYRQALALFEQVGDRLGQAYTLKAMGDVLQFQKDLEGAIGHYRQALALFEQVGSRLGQAYTLQAMGDVLRFQDDLEGAMTHYRQALNIFELLGDQWGKAATLHQMANIYATRGDLKAAIRAWQEALRIPYLPPDLREKIQADIFQAVQNIEDEDARAELQAALAPYLPEEARLQRPDDEETRTIDAHRRERTDTDLS